VRIETIEPENYQLRPHWNLEPERAFLTCSKERGRHNPLREAYQWTKTC
jgi:hypothetical protein